MEAKADAKANPSHHAPAASKSSMIGNAVQPKAQVHQKNSNNKATRRADIDSHGKNGFTSRSIRTNFGEQQVIKSNVTYFIFTRKFATNILINKFTKW